MGPTHRLSSLERLPDEVLCIICDLLAPLDDNRSGLREFSLTSRRCGKVATDRRLERVSFTVRGRVQIRKELERFYAVFGEECLRFIRQVRLISEPLWHELSGARPYDYCELPTTSTWLESIDFNNFPTPAISDQSKMEIIWQPLVSLIDQLPCLKDLIYSCRDQIPSCLLSGLYRHYRRYSDFRLHMHTFSLRSLYVPRTDISRPIDLHEYRLITSPFLHSIATKIFDYGPEGLLGYNEVAIERMIRGMAPNLKSVAIFKLRMPVVSPFPKPQRVGLGRPSHEMGDMARGKLVTLVLCGLNDFNQIDRLDQQTDFTMLRSLSLEHSLPVLQKFIQISQNPGLSALQSLDVDLSWCNGPSNDHREIRQATNSLLGNLPPLEILNLRGMFNESTMRVILDRHSPRLKVLTFNMPPTTFQLRCTCRFDLTPALATEMSTRFSLLETLELPVPRTRGDEQEVAIYRALGRLPRLRLLSIHLDGQQRSAVAVPHGLGYGMSHLDVRETLRNSAVDESLASSIARAIMMNPTSRLERIGLGILANRVADDVFRHVLLRVGPHWVATRRGERIDIQVWNSGMKGVLGVPRPHVPLYTEFSGRRDIRSAWESLWGPPADRSRPWWSIPLAAMPDALDS
jgi:hypothetical protein